MSTLDTDRWDETASGIAIPRQPKKTYSRPVVIQLGTTDIDLAKTLITKGLHVAAAVDPDPTTALEYLAAVGQYRNLDIDCEEDPRVEAVFNSAVFGDDDKPRPPRLAGNDWLNKTSYSDAGCSRFWIRDLHKITGKEILDALKLAPGDVALVVGTPRCVTFETPGRHQSNVLDQQRSAVFEFARLVTEINPASMLITNLDQLQTTKLPNGKSAISGFMKYLVDHDWGNAKLLQTALAAREMTTGKSRSSNPAARKQARAELRKQQQSTDPLQDFDNKGQGVLFVTQDADQMRSPRSRTTRRQVTRPFLEAGPSLF